MHDAVVELEKLQAVLRVVVVDRWTKWWILTLQTEIFRQSNRIAKEFKLN